MARKYNSKHPSYATLDDLREAVKTPRTGAKRCARRVLGGEGILTLRMRWIYAEALYKDRRRHARRSPRGRDDARGRAIAARVRRAYPLTTAIEAALQNARGIALRARDGVALRRGALTQRRKPQRQKLLVLLLGKRELDADDRVARRRAVQRHARDRRIFQFLL